MKRGASWDTIRSSSGLRHEFKTSGGVPKKWYTGRLHPKVRPLTLLDTVFDRKVPPFVYLPLVNDTLFHIPSIELCIPKCTVFKI